MIAILVLLSVLFPVGAWAHDGRVHCNQGPLSGKILEYYKTLPEGEHQKLYRAAYEAMNLDPENYKTLICDHLRPDGSRRKPAVSVQIPFTCTTRYVIKSATWINRHIQQNNGISLDNEKRIRYCREAQSAYEKVYEADDNQGQS